MDIRRHLREALANLLSSKLRSFLAILGILIGTSSVVGLVSSGLMATHAALQQFKVLGTDLFSVSLYQDHNARQSESEDDSGIDLDTLNAMPKTIPVIKSIAPYSSVYLSIASQGESLQGSVIGATKNLADILKISIQQGRFISFLDQYAFYCVIGHEIYEKMVEQGINDPVGKQINLGSVIFTIIGVAKPWPENAFFYENINRSAIIPIKTTTLLSKQAKISSAVMRIDEKANIEKLQDDVKNYIDSHVSGYHIYTHSPKEIIESMGKQEQTFAILLGLIAGISLLVGGIGVMNIMLVSVVERRREIGIRRALGAKRCDIQMLFLSESVTLSLFGGGMGVLLGVLISFLIALYSGWPFAFFLTPALVGFSVSVAIGIFFGFYPAYKASKSDPILALRSD